MGKKKMVVVLLVIAAIFMSGCNKAVPVSKVAESIPENFSPEPAIYNAEELEEKITEIISEAGGDWSVYVELPDSDFCVEINNSQVRAASTIKLFNMVTLFNEAEKGNVELTEDVYGNCYKMITVSSNSASNEIVRTIGKGNFSAGAQTVTEFAEGIGCTDTREEHMLYDVSGPAVGKNTTTVKDCATVLKKLYLNRLVSENADNEMLEILKAQTVNTKIPSLLPEGTVVAHKTGETSKVELDVGIVYSPACNYIVCISVENFGNRGVHSTFADISKTIYDFFNRQF